MLMEYCGGGDLSTIINQATKQNWSMPEDTAWHYSSEFSKRCTIAITRTTMANIDAEGGSRWVRILHRDPKPENGSPHALRKSSFL